MNYKNNNKRLVKRLNKDEQLAYDYLLDLFFIDIKQDVTASTIGKELNRRAPGIGCKYRNWAIENCESLVSKGLIEQTSKMKQQERFRLGSKADSAVAVELSKMEFEGVENKYAKRIAGNLEHIRTMRRMGYKVSDIAKSLGVNSNMLYRFVSVFPQLKHYFQEGATQANMAVANAVFTRAVGYDIVITKTTDIYGKNGLPTGETKVQTETRHIPGDVKSMALWLLNRDTDNWKDMRNINVEGELSLKALMKDIATQEEKDHSARLKDKLDPDTEVMIRQQA